MTHSISRPLAHTILATGGSGKERNLIYDPVNGRDIAGTDRAGKEDPHKRKMHQNHDPGRVGTPSGVHRLCVS